MILAPGTAAPGFDLVDQFGAPARLGDFLERGPVALVFFPLAFSRGCQGELCELRDRLDLFEEAGVQLVGVSVDSKYALRAWAEEQSYGFPLLSDFWPHGATAQAYGAFLPERGYATRATFVIGADGRIAASFAVGPGEARPIEAYRDAIAAVASR
ncbi:peroxiredoxin [Agromyces sp. MMS24-K17]|uniref:peroxiredoxin n=1 Tax=Agromyces sp. MMS24-K17 TaxID=3372850 RepID=UPI003755290B